jgi:predicted NBD/HSP70 family sugar kinase
MKILVIDVGGSGIKFKIWGKRQQHRFPSGRHMTPNKMVQGVLEVAQDWKYDVVSIGFPGPVIKGKPAAESPKLGKGWTKFDFEKHFKKPVKIINDAAMQALGSYAGGRMLFIGLGTGLGSALILDDVIVPLELGELAYSKNRTLDGVLGKRGLEKLGKQRWGTSVHRVIRRLRAAFRTDYLVIGGGNADLLKRLPTGARRGSNEKAFIGGARLWRVGAVYAKPQRHTWVIA